ncbi:GRAS domain-containing protein [Cephalotus follicularis]|uniref:GRAS domain-containing protein n=1 Tax=Cephalotus follicularis TaxID=3775 RepID=A0A1Q3CDW8_CEPFO|nr:GRAS domain-containing protein [Cephalotus follicularis]
MVMDPNFTELSDYINDPNPDNYYLDLNSDHYSNLTDGTKFNIPSPDLNFFDIPPEYLPESDPGIFTPSFTLSTDGDSFPSSSSWSPEVEEASSPSDDSDSSEPLLKYISQILMEENIEKKPSMFHDPLALQDTEKSLYEVIGEQYPQHPPPFHQPPSQGSSNVESPDSNFSGSSIDFGVGSTSSTSTNRTSSTNSNFVDSLWVGDFDHFNPPLLQNTLRGEHPFQFHSQPATQFSVSQNNLPTINDGLVGSSVNEFLVNNMFSDRESVLQFKRGLEEASKFLPSGNQLRIGLDSNTFATGQKEFSSRLMPENIERGNSQDGSRGRKNHERQDLNIDEERSHKQSALYREENELYEIFDKVLLIQPCKEDDCGDLQIKESRSLQQDSQSSGSNGGKTRGKKQGNKTETVDLRNLLILCAQAVSTNDRRTANEFLKQIRQHSSPSGDGSQRLAHCFANGLEARLAASGTEIKNFFASLFPKKSAVDILKAFKVYLANCPHKKFSFFFANKMIFNVAEKATILHIVDFGILYGFQWPMLIQHLSERPGGPPKLRITGIELPQPGFRPAERIEETGRRLAKYCERFNVPFEYNPIAAQNWETIQIEDIKINSNEVLAVNCLYRFKNLLDETVEVNCPRNAVLNLIRKMNPDIFVNTIHNGAYNAPFFLTRFREALFHFSAQFDMFDATFPRDDPERLMIEQEFYGREALNVIACEGLERVERPETYKLWQVRTMRAGFKPLPLNPELMKKFRCKLKAWYHKDFVLDEDRNWMLQGWKGRIFYASSCWVPA